MTREDVVKCSARFERLLKGRFKARGRGLTELTASVEDLLPPLVAASLREFARLRNALIHREVVRAEHIPRRLPDLANAITKELEMACEVQNFPPQISLSATNRSRGITPLPRAEAKDEFDEESIKRRAEQMVIADAALAPVVGSHPMTRQALTKALWNHIKKESLQDPLKKTMIHAGSKLRAVFNGKASVSMFEMSRLVSAHVREI